MSGTVNRGRNDGSQNLEMIEHPLLSPDELQSMPKGRFVVTKTGAYPMRTKLKLFKDWDITFGEPYEVEEKSARKVKYSDRFELEEELIRRNAAYTAEPDMAEGEANTYGGIEHAPAQEISGFPRRKDPVRIE